MKKSELDKPVKLATKKGEKEGEGTSKLYGDWQTEPWAPEAAVDGKVGHVMSCNVMCCGIIGRLYTIPFVVAE